MTYSEGVPLIREIFASLDGVPAEAIYLLGCAVEFAEPPLDQFGRVFDRLAFAVEHGRDPKFAEITASYDLRRMSMHPNCLGLLARLEGVDGPPWAALYNALAQVYADHRGAVSSCDR